MEKSFQPLQQIHQEIKEATWKKFKTTYSNKFKKDYDQDSFIVISSISILNRDTLSYIIPSIGFGTKTLPQSVINEANRKDVVSDMHAEMLAIRGFKRFICQQLKNHTNQYLQWNDRKQKYSLRQSFQVYLYCSEVLCGDCCINHQSSSFSGAKPLSFLHQKEYSHQKFKQNVLRTKPGRTDLPVDKRSAILSCSDLVGVMNILGIQGKMLFSSITPIYLSKIIIDCNQNLQDSLSRGIDLNLRLQNILNRSKKTINRKIFNIVINGKQRQISSQFNVSMPEIEIVCKQQSRNKEGFDLCGIFTHEIEEWLNGKTGLPEGSSLKNYQQKGKISKFSQSSLQNQFQFYRQNEASFKYTAILDRIQMLFGEWIDKAGE